MMGQQADGPLFISFFKFNVFLKKNMTLIFQKHYCNHDEFVMICLTFIKL